MYPTSVASVCGTAGSMLAMLSITAPAMAAVSHGLVQSLVVAIMCTCGLLRVFSQVVIAASVPRMAVQIAPSCMLLARQRASISASSRPMFVLSVNGQTISVARYRPIAVTTGETFGATAPLAKAGVVTLTPLAILSSG